MLTEITHSEEQEYARTVLTGSWNEVFHFTKLISIFNN